MDLGRVREAEFPITEQFAYFNNCGITPPPRRSVEAAQTFLKNAMLGGTMAEIAWMDAVERTRAKLARLINASPDEVAFVKNTSTGLAIVAQAVQWKAGDVILAAQGEFPAATYPWQVLEREGVETAIIPHADERITPELFEPYLKRGNVRMISLSWVQFHTGWRADLAAFGDLCRQYDVLLCLDAIQGLGALPLDVQATPVDFAVWGGNKWLLSIQGAGGLYVNQRVADRLRPSNVGWLGVAWENFERLDPSKPLQQRAARFEEGTRANVCLAALEPSLDLFFEVGTDVVAAQIRTLTDLLVDGLRDLGATIRSQRDGEHWSGIVAWTHDQRDLHADFERLTAANVATTIREGSLRAAPHFYNNAADVERLLDVLRD